MHYNFEYQISDPFLATLFAHTLLQHPHQNNFGVFDQGFLIFSDGLKLTLGLSDRLLMFLYVYCCILP